jgi:uncharacterized membrane protein YoaK (UPF0700 family)
MIGASIIHRTPLRRTARRWRKIIILTLLVQWIFLLTFVSLWSTNNNWIRQNVIQIILLGLAAFGMGIQGAIVVAFEFPGVVANAMTGVVIVLGRRIGKGIVGALEASGDGRSYYLSFMHWVLSLLGLHLLRHLRQLFRSLSRLSQISTSFRR